MGLTLQNRFLATLTATESRETFGTFDTFSGGRVSAETTTYHPGGMGKALAEVGPPSVENITISRYWDPVRDAAAERKLIALIGHPVTVGRQALDQTGGTIAGTLLTYTGRLAGVSSPEHDSTSNEVAKFEVEIVVEGLPAGQSA